MSQTNITPLNPEDFSSELYSTSDEVLITSNNEENQFNPNVDYVEFAIYDLNNNLIYPGGDDLSFSNYNLLDNEIYVDPEQDVIRAGINTGEINVNYSFLKKRLNSSPQSTYYIKEISSNRTEIRLDSNIISREDIITSTNEFISYREEDETFPDFYLNLGSNILLIANNIRLEENGTVLVKLYEPLPSNIEIKTSLWVVEKISNGLAYNVQFNNIVILPSNTISIKGPNINLPIKDENNNSSEETNLGIYTSPNSQSEYQLNSYFKDPSVNINVDYTDFSNFVNFSSAKARIENFWYKVSQIESASIELTTQSSFNQTQAVSSSIFNLNQIINDTITNFDNYEYYLYFKSSSDTYPKLPGGPPYENESTGSNAAISWYNTKLIEAENYDEFNYNWLKYSTPEYIQEDPNNDQYLTFLNMVGHFIDNDIWVYLKDTTNKWDADNRINAGVSKDLVAQVLRDMGIKLYQNNYSSGDLYSSFLGFTDSGSLFPFPYMTGSLPTPSGYEYISNFISSSDEAIPLDDINKRIYKRIYHNLPYLLKSKGTVAGLRALINSYGIPDTILRISEFGGKDRNNVNDWDLWKHQFNYQSKVEDETFISSSFQLNSSWGAEDNRPQTVQFRFKVGDTVASQSLWSLDVNNPTVAAVLEYDTDLPITSGSYSGSIIDPEYQYATLKFSADNFDDAASVRLPFYNGDWWSVQITREGNNFELLAANKIYSGSDGSQIGYIASSSYITSNPPSGWTIATKSNFPSLNGTQITTGAGSEVYEPLTLGYYQEIRYFNQPVSESVFRDYVMNPQSTEGNGINGSNNQLAFRASLGGDLYTGSMSIHPKVSGSYVTSSFTGNVSTFFNSGFIFEENKEWVFYDSPAVGIKNRNTDKIKRQDLVLPSGNTLSNIGSIQQKSYTTQDYTNNLNLLEVAFSPQNQINDDIISQIGFFNIGDYIGDPRLISSSVNTYPSLVDLSQEYFDKYSSNYDVYDYIRLIKFFDNSLFKMVKDFVPARTGIASGIVVKQHILERQKYPTPQAEQEQFEYTGSIGQTASTDDEDARMYIASGDFESNPLYTVEGGAGGSVNEFNRPVAFFRITDTPNVTLNNSTFTTLLDQSPSSKFAGANNPGVTFNPGGINNGEFKNGTGYDITTNFTFKFKNANLSQTLTIQLVEVDGRVIKEVSQTLSTFGASTFFTYHFNNVTLKKDKSYFFRAKSSSVGSPIINTFDVRFFQEGAPLDLRNGQFYEITNTTPVGDLTQVIGDSHEFYDGEYSGSTIITTDGELNPDNQIKEANTTPLLYDINLGINDFGIIGPYTPPSAGNISWNGERGPFERGAREIRITSLDINEVDKNGTNIQEQLSKLGSGVYIRFRAKIRFRELFPPPGQSQTLDKTFETTIASISGVTGAVWRIEFNNYLSLGFTSLPTDDYDQTLISDFEVVIDPLITDGDGFDYSNDNPLINNATKVTPSTIYYDLDYSQGSITPVNFDTVIAGTATKAELQDYNYFARRSIIPRYQGSRSTSNGFNLNTNNGGLGSLPNVEQDRAFFAYFNWVGGTSPLWGNGLEDRSALSIRYFVDGEGNVFEPTNDNNGINLGICRQTFTEGEVGVLSFDDEGGTSSNFSNLLGEQNIFKSGKRIIPIIYSQTQSISDTTPGGYTGSLEFVQGDQAESSVDDYRLTVFADSQIITDVGTVEFSTPTLEGDETNFANDIYEPTSNPSGQTPSVTLNFKAYIEREFQANAQTTFQFQKNSNGAGWVNLGPSKQLDAQTQTSIILETSDSTSVSTDDYRLQITSQNDAGQGNLLEISTNSYWKVTQTPPPSIGFVGPGASTPLDYWQKVGVTTNRFRTNALTSVYGQKQKDIEDSGFTNITTDFELQVGDEIRFQGTETQTYKITSIANSTSVAGAIVFTVDRNITLTNTEMNWFFVRRYVDAPGEIIIEADKPAGGTSPGFFMPLYSTKGIEDNFDTIIQKLKTDQLI